jgi:hypothetical protein
MPDSNHTTHGRGGFQTRPRGTATDHTTTTQLGVPAERAIVQRQPTPPIPVGGGRLRGREPAAAGAALRRDFSPGARTPIPHPKAPPCRHT